LVWNWEHHKAKDLIMQNDQTYLITGATGKVGKRVAEQLLAQGHRVRVWTNRAISKLENYENSTFLY
jgi:nucleoside-diphosphate-sugar epimerase